MIVCSNCGHENVDGGKFCVECGTKLVTMPKFCPECGTKLEGAVKFCPECGFNLVENINNSQDDVKQKDESHNVKEASSNKSNKLDYGDYDFIDDSFDHDYLPDTIRYGYNEDAKRLLDQSDVSDLTLYDISNAHNGKIIDLLAAYGVNFNHVYEDGFGDASTVLLEVINNYGVKLNDYCQHCEETGEFVYETEGDRFESEDDVHNKYLGIIDALIKHGADPSVIIENTFQPSTAIIKASEHKLTKLVCFLVEDCKVDINFVPKISAEERYKFYTRQIQECDCDGSITCSECEEITGRSALMEAINNIGRSQNNKKGIFLISKCLIENGADVNYQSKDYNYILDEWTIETPLSIALTDYENINLDLIRLLVKNGADYSEYDYDEEKLRSLFLIENDYIRNSLFSILEISNAQERYEDFHKQDGDNNDYEDDESVEEKIVSILDNYLPKICKNCTWYTKSSGAFDKPECRTKIENARTKIAFNRNVSEIVGLIDTSLLNKGTAGIVFLVDGIAFDYAFSKVTVLYKNMSDMFLDKELHFQHWIKNKDNSAYKGDVTLDSIFFNLSTLKECLEEIINIL